MRIVFFGSDEFGLPSLEELRKEHALLAVVTAPDRPKGRGHKIGCTPVKEWAGQHSIPVLQPEKLDQKFVQSLQEINPQLIVLISYGLILPAAVVNLPPLGAINLHPSLLPKYRGAAPIEWALINGETETGITIIKMNTGIDRGGILLQEKVPVSDSDNTLTLKKKLAELAPGLLLRVTEKLPELKPLPQEGKTSCAPKLQKELGRIDWRNSSLQIHNLIRALIEWPGAYTHLATPKGMKYLKILAACADERTGRFGQPGEVIETTSDCIRVACGQGTLKVVRLQLAGKNVLPAREFLAGNPINPGTILG